jgi:hypothetical protein
MTEAAPLFDAVFDGQPPQQFITLQAAMTWVEGLESPTGTISFEGQGIIRYAGGDIRPCRSLMQHAND